MPHQNFDDRFDKIDEKLGKLADKLKKLDDVFENQTYLKNSLDSLKEDLKRYRSEHKDLKKEVEELKVKFGEIQADNLVLKRDAKEAKLLADDIAQSKLQNEAMVSGLPTPLHMNPKDIVIEMHKKLNLSIKPDDITEVVKIDIKNKTNMASLIVKFSSIVKCADFIVAARKKRFKSGDLGCSTSNLSVFVNESLTENRRKIFYEARKFRLEKNYKFVWVKKGRIYLRLSENEKPILVKCLEDIDILRK